MTDIRQKALDSFKKTHLQALDNFLLWHVWKRAYHEGYDEAQARIRELEEQLHRFKNPLKHES